jgi:FixJ family two-component response regulator
MSTDSMPVTPPALSLSSRETQIMALIAAGHTNGEIATALTVAEKNGEEPREPDLRQAWCRLQARRD